MTHDEKKARLIAFEKRIQKIFEDGDLPFLVHLSGGNEDQLIELFKQIDSEDWIFSTHRSHYHYLLMAEKNGRLDEAEIVLENMIREGRSMFVYDKSYHFLTSSVLAGLCCPAAGVAASLKERHGLRNRQRVWCFVGDAAEDEGHFYEAVRYVHGHRLPCTFVIEDNNRSCDTSRVQRRGTSLGFSWPDCVYRYTYTPTYPHGGVGTEKRVTFKPEIVEKYAK